MKSGAPLALRAKGLVKRYGQFPALQGLDLEVPRGQVVGFLGVNGAGKSTTLKLIAGLLHLDAGFIEVDGIDSSREPLRAKAQLAYLPENPQLPERLTVLEHILFVARLYHLDEQAARLAADRWLEAFSLTERKHQRIGSLSHGMRQRLAMASLFLHQPRLLLIDEPMVGLDPPSAQQLKAILREQAMSGSAGILLSTHTLSVAEELCDQIIIIHRGACLVRGTRTTILNVAGVDDTAAASLERAFLKLIERDNEQRLRGEKGSHMGERS